MESSLHSQVHKIVSLHLSRESSGFCTVIPLFFMFIHFSMDP